MQEAVSDLREDLSRYRHGEIDPWAAVVAWVELPFALGLFCRYVGHIAAFAWLYDVNDWSFESDEVDFESRLSRRVCVIDPGLDRDDEWTLRLAACGLGLFVGAAYAPLATMWWSQLLLALNIAVCVTDPVWHFIEP